MKYEHVIKIMTYDVLVVLCECEILLKMILDTLENPEKIATNSFTLHISKTHKIENEFS